AGVRARDGRGGRRRGSGLGGGGGGRLGRRGGLGSRLRGRRRGRCRLLLLRLRGGSLGRGGGGTRGVADDRDDGTDLGVLVLLDLDLEQRAGDRGGDLGVDLVGGDLEQGLVDLDAVAHGLQPARDGALGNGLAERRHRDLGAGAAGGGGGGRLRGGGRGLVGGG